MTNNQSPMFDPIENWTHSKLLMRIGGLLIRLGRDISADDRALARAQADIFMAELQRRMA